MKKIPTLLFFILLSEFVLGQGYWKRLDNINFPALSMATVENSMVVCGAECKKIDNKNVLISYINQSNDGGANWKCIFDSRNDTLRFNHGRYFSLNNVVQKDRNRITAYGFNEPLCDSTFRFETTDGGESWSFSPVLDNSGKPLLISQIEMTNPKIGCCTDCKGRAYSIEDSGRVITELKGFDREELIIASVTRPNDSTFVVLVGQWNPKRILITSSDNGLTWTNHELLHGSTRVFFFDDKNGYIIRAEHDTNNVPYPEMLYKTTDGGKTLELVFLNDTPESGYLNDFFFADKNHFRLFGEKHFYYTNDGGQTWEQDSIVGINGSLNVGKIYRFNDSIMYYKELSTDIWKYYPGKYTSVEQEQPTPTSVLASPNPFTDVARVNFVVEQAGRVSIVVRNSMGEQVATREYFSQSGEQTFSLSGANLPAGIYFCDITASGKTYRAKAVLVRR